MYKTIGEKIGELVSEKNKAYGDSFKESRFILKLLYPNGISHEQFADALAIVRVIDKLFRIAQNKSAFGENPWEDIAGYAILSLANDPKYLSDLTLRKTPVRSRKDPPQSPDACNPPHGTGTSSTARTSSES